MAIQTCHHLPGQLGGVTIAKLIAQPADSGCRRHLQSKGLIGQHRQPRQFVISRSGTTATIGAAPTGEQIGQRHGGQCLDLLVGQRPRHRPHQGIDGGGRFRVPHHIGINVPQTQAKQPNATQLAHIQRQRLGQRCQHRQRHWQLEQGRDPQQLAFPRLEQRQRVIDGQILQKRPHRFLIGKLARQVTLHRRQGLITGGGIFQGQGKQAVLQTRIASRQLDAALSACLVQLHFSLVRWPRFSSCLLTAFHRFHRQQMQGKQRIGQIAIVLRQGKLKPAGHQQTGITVRFGERLHHRPQHGH